MDHKLLVIVCLIGIVLGGSIGYILFNGTIDPGLTETIVELELRINELEEFAYSRQSQIHETQSALTELETLLLEKENELKNMLLEMESTPRVIYVHNSEVGGLISEDQVWSGDITVIDHVMVPRNVSLTIKPGTMIRFKHYRGYRDPSKRLGMSVMGCLKAVGTPEQMIWFTSDADEPINGDWSMIHFREADPDSNIMYAVIECGQQGVNLWKSNITISHCIVRWHNWEGIYLESYSRPIIAYNRIYQNGYNGIAMEQYNQAILIGNTISHSGTNGVHVDASKAIMINNNITGNKANGLSVDDHGEIIAVHNTVKGNGQGFGFGEGENKFTAIGNRVTSNQVDVPPPTPQLEFEYTPGKGAEELVYDFPDLKPYDLGYTPSDPEKDRYMYVYPDTDETRRVIKKIGAGLGLTWSVTWDGEHLWTAVPWGIIYELNPETGETIKQFNFPGPQAWGMTYDGNHLWVNDFAEKKVYEVDLEGNVYSSFMIPDETGGAKGITWDGEYLCIMGWTTPTIYRVDKQGSLKDTIFVMEGAGGGLAWDGEYFWAPGGRGIAKINKRGQIVGSIYAASEGTWDLAWDGEYLWATQRTNENWMDAKLYKIEILDTN